MENLLRVGVISSTHGIKGEVKVFPTTDDVKRFSCLKNVIISTKSGNLDYEIESVKYFKQFVIIKFKGLDNINDVDLFKGNDILVTRQNAVKLKPNENFICDIVGCNVITDEGKELGIVEDVMLTGANDVYVVKTLNNKEVLIPVIKECVLDVNVEDKVIKVHLLDGLLDLND